MLARVIVDGFVAHSAEFTSRFDRPTDLSLIAFGVAILEIAISMCIVGC